jgi:carbamoyl-phosphate synthase large subunit
MDLLSSKSIDLVVNIPKNTLREELTNDYLIRRRAVDFGIPLLTDIHLAEQFVRAIARKKPADLQIKSWREYRRLAPEDQPQAVQVPERKVLLKASKRV